MEYSWPVTKKGFSNCNSNTISSIEANLNNASKSKICVKFDSQTAGRIELMG
jgi:hypothetical protein